jgi:hypothetical protein
MSEPERKRTSNEPDTFREVDGFGKPEAKPDPSSQRDPGTVRPVHSAPDATAVKRGGRERKRYESVNPPLSEPERALAKDATDQARQLSATTGRSMLPIPGGFARS